jgi:hypothetical protein
MLALRRRHRPADPLAHLARGAREVRLVTRAQLEHVVRAAAMIADDREIVVIGSQAVLGQFPDAPADLLVSVEADLYPRNHPERADLIDGSIGELSPFHQSFGYYAHGVGEETAVLPLGWTERLVPIPLGEVVGLCLEIHDLALSKWAAGREKDREFARGAVEHGLVERATLLERLETMPIDPSHRSTLYGLVEAAFAPKGPRLTSQG